MAHSMKLHSTYRDAKNPTQAFDHIWNTSHGVGTPGHERNHPLDVELIQALIKWHDTGRTGMPIAMTAAIKQTGRLDAATIDAIRFLDPAGDLQHGKHWRISPARYGSVDYFHKEGRSTGRRTYFVAQLNWWFNPNCYDEWSVLPDLVSPALQERLRARPHF